MEDKRQVFFLHFAGGSSTSYNFLSGLINDLEVHQLELPGRGNRRQEPFVKNIESAVEDYTSQIMDRLNNQPFVVFGHSMGAAIGIHVVKRLELFRFFPKRLVVSGYAGPGVSIIDKKKRYLMKQKEFLQELKEIGGMPPAFYKHRGLVNYFSPIIRSDFRIIEEEESTAFPPVSTPIFAMMGSEEKSAVHIENWQDYTASDFQYQIFNGNHFFIHQYEKDLAQIIRNSFD